MSFAETIARKRDGLELSRGEICAFVAGASHGTVGDEQLAALLMAFCIRGASARETRWLVEEMRDSGVCWRLAEVAPHAVDKHSTGGVGDTVSLVLTPLLAACGVPVAMMAGAGLAHSQGTLDKLSAIPGFRVARGRDEALELLARCGACFAAQSAEIAPADRKLYGLRDVTGTVPSLPLIVASIMSKKLAVGAGRLVLDVKSGSGAFCKTPTAARELATGLLEVAWAAGVKATALITDMEQPLGTRLGCACEVRAALEALDGQGEERLRALSVELAVEALTLSGRSRPAAIAEVDEALSSGRARRQWEVIVEAHGGAADPAVLPSSQHCHVVTAARRGFLTAVDAETLGWVAVGLGAGRQRQEDKLDYAASVKVQARVGDFLEAGQPLATLEAAQRPVAIEALAARVLAAFTVGEEPPPSTPLVLERLSGSG